MVKYVAVYRPVLVEIEPYWERGPHSTIVVYDSGESSVDTGIVNYYGASIMRVKDSIGFNLTNADS